MASNVKTYKRSESVVFFKTRESFGELSNMRSGYPLKVQGVTVLSSEALYQACRFPHLPEVQEKVITQTSPMTAKMVSKPYRSQTREDWDEIRVAVMKWCLRVKLLQHWKEFGDALLRTGNRPIVEQSYKDPFWGAIPDESGQTLRGTNVLGRLLMELRQLLTDCPLKLQTVKPVPVEAFCLLGKPIKAIKADKKQVVTSVVDKVRRDFFDEPNEAPAAKSAPPPKRQLMMFELPVPRKAEKKKPQQRNYHVVSNARRGGWDVWREGGKRASAHFRTKVEAVERGRQLARSQRVELIPHKKETTARASDVQQTWLAA